MGQRTPWELGHDTWLAVIRHQGFSVQTGRGAGPLPPPARILGRATLFLAAELLGPGGRDMYPKQVSQGVEMGAEVSPHWGSATLQAPQSLGNGEGMGSGLSLEQVVGMACLDSWLSLHRPGPPWWHPAEPLNLAGWPWGSVPSPLCHSPCPLLHQRHPQGLSHPYEATSSALCRHPTQAFGVLSQIPSYPCLPHSQHPQHPDLGSPLLIPPPRAFERPVGGWPFAFPC